MPKVGTSARIGEIEVPIITEIEPANSRETEQIKLIEDRTLIREREKSEQFGITISAILAEGIHSELRSLSEQVKELKTLAEKDAAYNRFTYGEYDGWLSVASVKAPVDDPMLASASIEAIYYPSGNYRSYTKLSRRTLYGEAEKGYYKRIRNPNNGDEGTKLNRFDIGETENRDFGFLREALLSEKGDSVSARIGNAGGGYRMHARLRDDDGNDVTLSFNNTTEEVETGTTEVTTVTSQAYYIPSAATLSVRKTSESSNEIHVDGVWLERVFDPVGSIEDGPRVGSPTEGEIVAEGDSIRVELAYGKFDVFALRPSGEIKLTEGEWDFEPIDWQLKRSDEARFEALVKFRDTTGSIWKAILRLSNDDSYVTLEVIQSQSAVAYLDVQEGIGYTSDTILSSASPSTALETDWLGVILNDVGVVFGGTEIAEVYSISGQVSQVGFEIKEGNFVTIGTTEANNRIIPANDLTADGAVFANGEYTLSPNDGVYTSHVLYRGTYIMAFRARGDSTASIGARNVTDSRNVRYQSVKPTEDYSYVTNIVFLDIDDYEDVISHSIYNNGEGDIVVDQALLLPVNIAGGGGPQGVMHDSTNIIDSQKELDYTSQ